MTFRIFTCLTYRDNCDMSTELPSCVLEPYFDSVTDYQAVFVCGAVTLAAQQMKRHGRWHGVITDLIIRIIRNVYITLLNVIIHGDQMPTSVGLISNRSELGGPYTFWNASIVGRSSRLALLALV